MSSTESIVDELRADILNGQFGPGERLVEQRLTEQYSCGRLAVRTALVELATQGLVDRHANRGATVRDVSIDEAIQITQARSALESLIAAQAAVHATTEQRRSLQAIGAEMAEAVAQDNRDDYSKLNEGLHRVVRDSSGHDVAAELVAGLRDRGAQHRFRLGRVPGRAAESLEQHRAIIQAIVEGDSDAAALAMEQHLASVVDTLRSWPGD